MLSAPMRRCGEAGSTNRAARAWQGYDELKTKLPADLLRNLHDLDQDECQLRARNVRHYQCRRCNGWYCLAKAGVLPCSETPLEHKIMQRTFDRRVRQVTGGFQKNAVKVTSDFEPRASVRKRTSQLPLDHPRRLKALRVAATA
jgi:hypothetical protein